MNGTRRQEGESDLEAIAAKFDWDLETTKKKVASTKDILVLSTEEDAIDFLLHVAPEAVP